MAGGAETVTPHDPAICRPDGWGCNARVPHGDVVPESELRSVVPQGVR
jgi:hypothetical protein